MESVVLDSSAVIALFNSADLHHGAIVAAMVGSSATFDRNGDGDRDAGGPGSNFTP